MKTLKYFLFLFLVSLAVVSCDERDIDMPPLPTPEYKGDPANITIKALKEKFNTDALTLIEDSLIVEVRVVGNDVSGNIYKQMIVQDASEEGTKDGDGYGIVLSIDFAGSFTQNPVGQKLFINLKGLYIGKYGGEHQIGGNNAGSIGRMSKLAFDDHVIKDGNPIVIKPKVVKISDLATNSNSYVNTLIQIDNVEFVNGGTGSFAPAGVNATNQDVKDASGNKITVRTSQYADFAKNTLPVGSGSIVGILGRFNGGWQFTLRAAYDLVNFGGKGTKGNPYTVSEAIAKGMDGSQGWVKGYIIGSAGLGISETNPIKDANGFLLTAPFLKNSVVIAEKANETDWQKYMVIQLPAGTDIEKVNLEDHAGNKGKEINIGGVLKTVFGRPGIQTNGTAGDYVFDDGSTPSGPEPKGDGTKENPFNYYAAVANQGQTAKWIKAYIVGSVKDKSLQADSQFEGPFTNAANVLIAASPTEKNPSNCIPVQLVFGTDVRTKVNLVDNPTNLGKEVMLLGDLVAYFGAPGLKNTTDFVLDGQVAPPDPDPSDDALFSETFGLGSYPNGNRPKIADFTDFDMKSPIVYSDASGKADIRTSGTASVWFPKGADVFLTISGINTTGYSKLKLSYDVAANVYTAGETTDLNSLKVSFNGQSLVVPSKVVAAPDDANKFHTMEVDLSSIPTGNNITLEFMAPNAENGYGLRLDNIKITGSK